MAAAAPDSAEMAVPVDAVPKVVATAMATVGPNATIPPPGHGTGHPSAASNRLGPLGFCLDPPHSALEPIDFDAILANRPVELLGRTRQSVHVVLDRLDHFSDGPLPLLEQPHAGLSDLLAEGLMFCERLPELLYRLATGKCIEHHDSAYATSEPGNPV